MKPMKALRWHGKEDIRVDKIPVPQPRSDEVLIKVTFSGICGSEVHEYLSGPIFIPTEPHPLTGSKVPQTMGHEFGGRVVARGSDVRKIPLDALVSVNPLLSCGCCRACLRKRPNLCEQLAYYGLIGDGGHAEYAVAKAANCVRLPDDAPAEYVAFGEPAAVAYHAVKQARIKPGSIVAVLGGGAIGQLVVQYARYEGAAKVFMTEPAACRMRLAKEIGAVDEVFNPLDTDVTEEIQARTDGQGVDYAFECCGGSKDGLLEDTAAQAVDLTRAEGTVVVVGTFAAPTEFHFNSVVLMERRIVGSWVWHSHSEYCDAMKMIVGGKIRVLPLITGKTDIDGAVPNGIWPLHVDKDEHLKILLDFTQGDE